MCEGPPVAAHLSDSVQSTILCCSNLKMQQLHYAAAMPAGCYKKGYSQQLAAGQASLCTC
jgi:hypothetical protein